MSVPPEQMPPQAPPQGGMMGQPPALDTAATANQPQVDEAAQTETFEAMVAGLRDYIFAAGEQGIVERMGSGDGEPGKLLGEIVYGLVKEGADQAEKAGKPIDWDMMMGVATQLIDDIVDLMGAHGMEIAPKDKEFALLYAQQLYVEQQQPDDEQRNAAKQDLAQLKQNGDVDTATKYVQMRGQEAGGDPFGVNEMPGGSQRMMNQ